MTATSDILLQIVARKREELRDANVSADELRKNGELLNSSRRDFAAALRGRHPAVIAEIKKASPSKGVLVENFQPATLAAQYERGGAAALSVLTDRDFFQGSVEHLQSARRACRLPVLRKDFTVSEYHIYEAAAMGADAILLIAAVLDSIELKGFRQLANQFGLAALVEVHDAEELDRALDSGAEIVGVNNRDLRTFQVRLETSIDLAPRIPDSVIKVSESGIFQVADIQRLAASGYSAFLVGEHLVKSGDPARSLRELVA